MADADLDVIIRQLAKQQHKTLTAAVKKQWDRYAALAANAKDADSKKHLRQLGKDIVEIGTATVKRLQMSADNAAYSYGRAVRQTVEAAAAKKPTKSAKTADTVHSKPKSGKKATRKAAAQPKA